MKSMQASGPKVDFELARRIRELLGQGLTAPRIADMLGIGKTAVLQIKHGKHWTDRPGGP